MTERHGWFRKRPPDSEIDELEAALEEAYPWFVALWPKCPAGHRLFQLGLNPEPAVVLIHRTGKTHVRCVRCKRQADRESRQRRKNT